MAQVKGRLAVLTGGGDCPGLNAVIRAVVKTMKLMDYASVSGILPRGGTILGTTNRDNPFHFAVEENGKYVFYDKREEVVKNLRDRNIEALVVIGGDGSLNIAAKLAAECDVKVVGVPKTIESS